VAYHYAYVTILSPQYEYAYILYFPPPSISVIVTYVTILAPVIGYRHRPAPAAYGAALIYAIAYVPAQLFLLFNWQQSIGELATLQVIVGASMMALLWTSSMGREAPASTDRLSTELAWTGGRVEISPTSSTLLAILTALASVATVYLYRDSMRVVPLDDVYDLRFEAAQVDPGVLISYTLAWLLNLCLPFYFARGILRKNAFDVFVALAISALIYVSTGVKAAAFMGPSVLLLILLYNSREQFFFRLLVILFTAVVVFSVIPADDDGPLRFARALFLIRVLGTGGWSMALYHEFFNTNGFTYYTHIGPIAALTSAYPYGRLSLGQLIGLQYFGSEEANFNANFWASDGIAALGIVGIPVVTAAICGLWYMINRASREYSTRFIVAWLCGFWQALLNAPLTIAIVSCGGALVIGLLWLSESTESVAEDDEEPGDAATDPELKLSS
jgi:hypothetical protein